MIRRRHLALPKKESKIVTQYKRTICTTIEGSNFKSNIFEPKEFQRLKK